MGKINWIRVLLGGLLCGLVFNVGEGFGGTVMMEEWSARFSKLGIDMNAVAQDPAIITFALGGGFLYGLICVWLYAAIRPRFGPGPKTAIIAALTIWFVGYFWPTIAYSLIGLWPTRLALIAVAIGLAETVVGTLAGAWLYKEA